VSLPSPLDHEVDLVLADLFGGPLSGQRLDFLGSEIAVARAVVIRSKCRSAGR
jgi:hypothetical protein